MYRHTKNTVAVLLVTAFTALAMYGTVQTTAVIAGLSGSPAGATATASNADGTMTCPRTGCTASYCHATRTEQLWFGRVGHIRQRGFQRHRFRRQRLRRREHDAHLSENGLHGVILSRGGRWLVTLGPLWLEHILAVGPCACGLERPRDRPGWNGPEPMGGI